MTDIDPVLLEAEAYGLRIERDALRTANTRLLEILRKYGWRPPPPHDAAKEIDMSELSWCTSTGTTCKHEWDTIVGHGVNRPGSSFRTMLCPKCGSLDGLTYTGADAAGEEPVLPEGYTWDGANYIYEWPNGGKTNAIVLDRLSPDDFIKFADHKKYRQRLQDKREKEVEPVVTERLMNYIQYLNDTRRDPNHTVRQLNHALDLLAEEYRRIRDEADGEGK